LLGAVFLRFLFLFILLYSSNVFAHEGEHDDHNKDEDKILIFSKTSWYRHPKIPEVNGSLVRLFDKHHVRADVSESSKDFNEKNLSQYKVILFQSTTDIGVSFDEKQKAAFKKWYSNGGGLMALHAAFVHHKHWDWFSELAACDFDSDSEHVETKIMVDPSFAGNELAAGHKKPFMLDSEWLNFDKSVTGVEGVKVVLRADDTSFEPVREFFKKKGKKPMEKDHPVSWIREWNGGKLFYTGIGHDRRSIESDFAKKHLMAAYRWLAKD